MSPSPILVDKVEQARQTEALRLKKEGVTPPARKGTRLPFEELQANRQAQPTLRTSLLDLDLSRPPSEDELIKAGQLGDALSPTRSADVSKIQDPEIRAKQEKDNWAFGRAIQTWNQHRYDEAVSLFTKHMQENPNSPWAAESRLHIGCAAQYRGQYDVCYEQFGFILDQQPKGSDMYQKALLRSANVQTMQGRFKEAAATYQEALRTEQSSSRKTYASAWLPILAQYVKQQTAMRDCVQKSLKEVCTILGLPEEAKKMENVRAPREDGFTAAQVLELCHQCGLDVRAVRIDGKQTEAIEFPFLAHYKDQHFVAVFAAIEDSFLVYDSRVGFQREISITSFKAQWSGFAVALNGLTTDPRHRQIEVASLSERELNDVVGGCCGVMPSPSKMGGPDEKSPCCDGNKNAPGTNGPSINPPGAPPGDNEPSTRQSPSWWVNPISFNMVVRDTPMWWDSPYGLDLNFIFTFNSLDTLNAIRPVGPKWVLNYGGYAMEDPSGKVIVVAANGNQWEFLPKTGGGYTAPNDYNAILIKTGPFEFQLTDLVTETVLEYGRPSGVSTSASLFLSITDRWGVSIISTYNSNGTLTNVTHSKGGIWDVIYNLEGLIERIDDPFGRSAYFAYDDAGTLREIEDMGGVRYSFRYSNGNQGYLTHAGSGSVPGGGGAINATPTDQMLMTEIVFAPQELPYMDEPNRAWYPLIYRFESHPPENDINGMWGAYSVAVSEPYGGTKIVYYDGLDRGSYRTAAQVASGSNGTSYTYIMANGEGHLASLTFPLGGTAGFSNYNTAGVPLTVTRRDGLVLTRTVNAFENPLTIVDSTGRTMTYDYDPNNIDLKKVTGPDGVEVIEINYNSDRLPSDVYLRNGNQIFFTYNSQGQMLTKVFKSSIGSAVKTITYTYNAGDLLESVDIDGRTVANYTFDTIGRLITSTDEDGASETYTYDDLNRVTKIIYHDGTFEELAYHSITGMIDWARTREGQQSLYFYDRRGYRVAARSAGQRLTYWNYNNDGQLTLLIDPKGNKTVWEYDIEGRLLKKILQDGALEQYTWNVKSQLSQQISPRGMKRIFSYDALGRLTNTAYQDSGGTTIFPAESLTYDILSRVVTSVDGEGTTTYNYDSAARISSINGPYNDDTVDYTYDDFSRIDSITTPGSVTQSFSYDNDERLSGWTDIFGDNIIAYSGRTSRVTGISRAGGLIDTSFSYEGVEGLFKLEQIKHESGGSLVSQFDYTWNAQQDVSSWKRILGSSASRETQWDITHDVVHQLSGATLKEVSSGAIISDQRLGFDSMGNRTMEHDLSTGVRTEYAYNNTNQMVDKKVYSSDQKPWVKGSLNEAGSVNIDGKHAVIKSDNSFEVQSTSRAATITAKDTAGNITAENWRLNSGSSSTADDIFLYAYDTEGNLLSDGVSMFEWDLRNRLTAIVTGTHRTEFTYDGSNRRVGVKERTGGAITSDLRYIYAGIKLLEERSSNNSIVLRRFYNGGHVDVEGGGTRYAYTTDHLESIREVMILSGSSGNPTTATLVARYDYDLWGRRVVLDGGTPAETLVLHGFTGHVYHARSGLWLTPYRAYDSALGRFISRDPIQEDGGLNLYAYVGNQHMVLVDPLGLGSTGTSWGIAIGGGIGGAVGGFVGATGGTFVVPGVGTVSGGWALGSAGVLYGGALGGAVGNFAEEVAGAAGEIGSDIGNGISNIADGISSGIQGIKDWFSRGKESGHNWATDQAREAAGRRGDPCKELDDMLRNATDPKIKKDIVQAQKFLGCRNKKKREENY